MRKMLYITVLAAFLGFAQATPASSASIGFAGSGLASVIAGDTYSFNVVVSGLESYVVEAYALDLLYNSHVLSLSSVSFSPMLGTPNTSDVAYQLANLPGTRGVPGPGSQMFVYGTDYTSIMSSIVAPVSAGELNISEMTNLSDQDLQSIQGNSGQVVLATLNFTALSTGNPSLAFDWYPGQDIKGNNNVPIAGYIVPEPSTMLLFCSGIASLLLFRRKFNRCGRFFGK